MRTTTAVIAGALALVTAASVPTVARADMGMGELGPQLGGSQDDMVLDDPGKLPREPDMIVNDPGRLPREPDMVLDDPGRVPREADMIVNDPGTLPPQPQMDIERPQDLDSSDDID